MQEDERIAGERRQLTVLFCDLVASTELAGRLDPEDFCTVIRTYDETAAHAVERFGGHIAQYLGDGLLAYFGYPQAHEDDAERAVRAGLAIVDEMARVNGQFQEQQLRLAVRIGIHTGPVVIDKGGDAKPMIFGQTPAIAARVQCAAEPDTVLISRATHQLVAGVFVVEDRGPCALKGVEDRLRLYRVVRPSGVRGRFDAASRHLTPFVDRESERRLLRERWEQARSGKGQVVTIVGEAGIGKSRLVRALQEDIAGEPHVWIKFQASPHHRNVPFHAVVDMLEVGFGWREGRPEAHLANLDRSLRLAGVERPEAVALIAPLLGLEVPEHQRAVTLSPDEQRRALLATLASWLVGLARVQPVVALFEDIQWADPSTLELLALLGEQAASAPLLLLHTCRSGFRAPWPLLSHHTLVTLTRLSPDHIREMIRHVAARAAPTSDVIEALVARAEGVPLFAEELWKGTLGAGGRPAGNSIPATLADSLMARLDRLGPAKDVAQLGAVLGREFTYPVLRAVSPLSDRELQRALSRLSDADLLFVHGVPPEATYVFGHALLRDAAYECLVRTARQQLHARVAATLKDRFPEIVRDQPEVVARHLEHGGDLVEAARYWKRAGDRATARAAYTESIALFERGLRVLDRLPPARQRMEQELALIESLATALPLATGYSEPEAERTLRRALDLSSTLGVAVPVRVLHGVFALHVVRSDRESSTRLLSQFQRRAERSDDPVVRIAAHANTGLHAFLRGDFACAREEMEKATEWYDTPGYRAFFQEYGYDGGLYPFGFLTWILWILGYPQRSLEMRDRAMALVEGKGNPYSCLIVLTFAAALAHDRREPDTARDLSERVIVVASEQDIPYWLGPATCLRGWAAVEQGRVEEGIADIQRGLDILRGLGFRTWYPYYASFLGEADLARGRAADGLVAVREALGLTHVLLDRFYEAELLRLEGDLLRLQGDLPAAEASVRRALDVASRQQARAYELRAATTLCRLLRDGAGLADARGRLARVYGTFTDGFDTRDLREAKTLLDESPRAGPVAA
jgi:class 3 adenylate cyclase/tetratricopeptide (TPR) repeat protein